MLTSARWMTYPHRLPVAHPVIACLVLHLLTPSRWSISPVSSASENSRSRGTLSGSKQTWVETLSWKPRVYMYHNILTDEECQHLIDLGNPHLEQFQTYDRKTGKMLPNKQRTGTGYFLSRGQDGIVRRIERRIADLTFIPVDHGQGLHVLKYEPGQIFGPHRDQPMFTTQNMRLATLLMYLTDPPAGGGGGETVFMDVRGGTPSNSSCGARGLVVQPKKGSAVFFYSLNPDGTLDEASIHQGCAPIGGEKWAATKILWRRTFDYAEVPLPSTHPHTTSKLKYS